MYGPHRGIICTRCGREVNLSFLPLRGTDIQLCKECDSEFTSEYNILLEKYTKFYQPSSFDYYIKGRKFNLNG